MIRVLVLVVLLGGLAHAQPARPPALRDVGIEEHVGERLPMELVFNDTAGRRATLGSAFEDGRPVLLVLTYVRCKTLCSLVLRGTIDAIHELPLELGRDYRVVLVSIDATEDVASAAARQREITARLDRGRDAFTYLVGAERTIRTLADRLGFRFKVDPRSGQIAHPAVIFVITPDGRISRYLQGIEFPPDDLAASLRAAAVGNVQSSSIAASVLDCFRFDPAARAHRDQIETYLRIGGASVMIALGSSIGLLLLWERRRRRTS